MNALEKLGHCPDVATLKPALQRLCEKFGQVERLDVLTAIHQGTRQAVCFLRLDSPEKEQVLMKTLGVDRFGERSCLWWTLARPWSARTQVRPPSGQSLRFRVGPIRQRSW